MLDPIFSKHSHRRYNILTDEYVLVSPHRTQRPWQGQKEKNNNIIKENYNKNCYLCPGNNRAFDNKNINYKGVYVFENDYPALSKSKDNIKNENKLLKSETERGICKVICYSHLHNLSMAKLSLTSIIKVIETWKQEYIELSEISYINHVQIFENKGEIMGCSNPHPHGQIWAQESIPDITKTEFKTQHKYFKNNNISLLTEYLRQELELQERIIFENKDFVVLSPFWAVWPFETIIISKDHKQNIACFSEKEIFSLAEAIQYITIKYDNLFLTDFPYSMGIHQAPVANVSSMAWHFHIHFYPPLLRSADIKKFMVGYEMMANPQRDFTPEYAAQRLKSLPDIHFEKI